MKILVRAPFSESKLEVLKEYFDEIVYDPWNVTGERYYEDEMLKVLNDVKPDVLITELDRITEKVVSNYKGLKVIGDCRAVPANIDIEACTKYNIPVLCTPGRNAQAVAEMLIGLLLCYMRNVIPANKWAVDGGWTEGTTPYFTWMGNELQGKSIGFVGFGAVGQAAAKMLEAFGCEIYYYDPFVNVTKYTKMELKEIFSQADIVSLHLPVTKDTVNLIDESLLSRMKKSAILVNTARSAVMVTSDLIKVLESNSIKGAILDVLDTEPPTSEDIKIASYNNVLLTPHICGASYEIKDHQSDILTDRLVKWFENEELHKIIDNK